MANYKLYLPELLKVEGGLSKSKQDKASVNPVPDGSGYHTNKGVTWTTFSNLSKKLGYKPDIALFYKMPDSLVGLIFKHEYWDGVHADGIKSQGIAENIADWAYHSGPGTALKQVKKFLGLPAKATPQQFVDRINKTLDEKSFIAQLIAYRKHWLLALPGSANDEGWMNRLNSLYKSTVEKIGTTGIASGLTLFLIIVVIGLYLINR